MTTLDRPDRAISASLVLIEPVASSGKDRQRGSALDFPAAMPTIRKTNAVRFALAAVLASGRLAPAGRARLPDPARQIPAGKVEELAIASKVYAQDRRVWIYTSPDYSASSHGAYDLLVCFDGGEYLDEIPLPRILDDLLARGKAGPFVGVLIDNGTSARRLADLANHDRFVGFLAEEVLPWARQRWRVTRDPHRTIVAGPSAGGLAAAYVAFRRPDLFGNVLSQSGAFWRGNEGSNGEPYEWLTSQVAAAAKRDVRFLLEVGSRESKGALGGAAPSILHANRRLRDALRAKV